MVRPDGDTRRSLYRELMREPWAAHRDHVIASDR